LEALRRKRTEREVTDLESHPETTQIRVVDIEVPKTEVLKIEEPEIPSVLPEEPAAEPATPKKGRAAMPSWDEIVFGTKTDD
jgi:hypothetical protein